MTGTCSAAPRAMRGRRTRRAATAARAACRSTSTRGGAVWSKRLQIVLLVCGEAHLCHMPDMVLAPRRFPQTWHVLLALAPSHRRKSEGLALCPEREVHAQIQMRRHTGRKGIKTQSLHLQKSLNRPAVQCDPMLRLPHTAGRARHPVACEDGCGRCRAPCTRLAGATLAACEDEHTEYITWVGRSLWRVQEQCRSSAEA